MPEQQSVAADFFVSPDGDDRRAGTRQAPFATLARAQRAVRESDRKGQAPITVRVRGGTYYLDQPLVFAPVDSGTADAPIAYQAYPGELVTLSGGRKLDCAWRPYRDRIRRCELPEVKAGRLNFSQLFVNGQRQIRARFPNYDASDPKNFSGQLRAAGTIADDVPDPHPGPDDDMTFSGAAPRGMTFDPATFTRKRWARPAEAVIHIFQAHGWGNLQWQIKDIDWERGRIWFGAGGQQMGAKWAQNPCEINDGSRYFIENVFEELDAPGEWYLDREAGVLYYLPPADIDMETAVVEAPVLRQLVRFTGTQEDPVHHISLQAFRLAHSASTFLDSYSVPSLSDWSIHRGGAVLLDGARDCAVKDCFFDAVGGNAIFVNDYNRGHVITGCKFTGAGDSAICFVGSLETTVGTQRHFPYDCQATNNLIHDCGVFGKQIAGVYISRARRIRVAHNEIYNLPRAGICIGDGTWGGHLIEYNHIHTTCRETGDHGPFNAWGRDKYWCLVQSHGKYVHDHSHDAGQVKQDAMEPVVVRHNLFEETSGWGLDLDDGASYYEIYNNLCLGVSVKLREGAYRAVYNNVWVHGANSPCFHVGNEHNHDRYFRNITVTRIASLQPDDELNFAMGRGYGEMYTLIAPPARGPWLEEIDYNCFYSDRGKFVARVQERGSREDWQYSLIGGQTYSLDEWRGLGFDRHSIFADPMFVDPDHGDYRVKPESPALKLGFVNFDARQAGLTLEFPEQWREAAVSEGTEQAKEAWADGPTL